MIVSRLLPTNEYRAALIRTLDRSHERRVIDWFLEQAESLSALGLRGHGTAWHHGAQQQNHRSHHDE